MSIYYHVTYSSRIPSIRKHGLLISHRKEVRISQKNVIYVMKDLMHAGMFASEMSYKSQRPASILHVRVDPRYLKQDYNTLAVVGVWYEYHHDIKPKDIIKVDAWDAKAKKRHMKLMNKVFKR